MRVSFSPQNLTWADQFVNSSADGTFMPVGWLSDLKIQSFLKSLEIDLRKRVQERLGDTMDDIPDIKLIIPVMLQLFKTGLYALHPDNTFSDRFLRRILFRLVSECVAFESIRNNGFLGSFLYVKNFSATIVKLLLSSDDPEYRALLDEWFRDISISPQDIAQRIEEIEEKRQNNTMVGTMLENIGEIRLSLNAGLADVKTLQLLDKDELEETGMEYHRAKKMIEKLDDGRVIIEQMMTGMESILEKIA